MNRLSIILLACLSGLFFSCNKVTLPGEDDFDGSEILLSAEAPLTKASYSPMQSPYKVSVSMFQYGNTTALGTATYSPDPTKTDGSLIAKTSTKLYWPDNVNKYGFTASAGLATLSDTQNVDSLYLANDLLSGYSALASESSLAYRTSKDWYKDNNKSKVVPLKLQHQRSRITIILKAGFGVKREEILYPANGLTAKIYSYSSADENSAVEITPLEAEGKVNYDLDENGPAIENAVTTMYDAIVEPFSYKTNSDFPIVKISLNGQQFTYYAAGDKDATSSTIPDAYELSAGKHLTLTITLSRDSRRTLITALLEDWNDVTVSSVCDDYGANGDPIIIKNVTDLQSFLSDPEKNKPGSVAIVSATRLNLESPVVWDPGAYTLNSNLNLAGCIISTSSRLFEEITPAGALVEGQVIVGQDVNTAIAMTNNGIIERIMLSGKNGAIATTAGMVELNSGTISNCTSSLPVCGTGTYIGGIAARSLYASDESDVIPPMIDKCTVDAKVSGSGYTALGGIVGYASGKISNNNYEYGITLNQDKSNSKNIIGAKAIDTRGLDTRGNTWPSIDEDAEATNANTGPLYTGIVDCQSELASMLENQNEASKSFRIAADFDIESTWETPEDGDPLLCFLDGNGKTITSHGKMLFHTISSEVKDFELLCADNVESVADEFHTDGIAPLAFDLSGENAKLSSIKVKTAEGKHIKASTPSGLVVRAFNGATIENCEVTVTIKIDLTGLVGETARNFIGGIASTADEATFTGCQVHSGTVMTIISDSNTQIYMGGIVGGAVSASGGYARNILITDCNSWWWTEDSNVNHHVGAIIGRANDGSNDLANTLKKGCQGNWWKEQLFGGVNTIKAVGELPKNITDETKIIGKRNSVTPNETN